MSDNNAIDTINHPTMRAVVDEYDYSAKEGLNEPEKAALAKIADQIRNGRILDVGIGAGRTVAPLMAISGDYTGVDYAPEMIAHCRHRFPGVHLEVVDARDMRQFESKSFDLIVFACNGISMVDHTGRLAILKEVHRLLKPDGFFLFSTCNFNSAEHRRIFNFPHFLPTAHPAKFLVRALRFLSHCVFGIINRLRYKRFEIHASEYAIINDKAHDYRTMLYFITLENQLKQLAEIGFKPDADVFDFSGQLVADTTDSTLTLLVRP